MDDMFAPPNTKEVYIFVFNDENQDLSKYECKERLFLTMQRCILDSSDIHILIALDEGEQYEGRRVLTPYEVGKYSTVKNSHRELKDYEHHKYRFSVTPIEHKRLKRYLHKQVRRKTDFNYAAYLSNFMPITRWCPCEGSGLYCAQFIMNALLSAGIIRGDIQVETTGILPWFLCCIPLSCVCPDKSPVLVDIPPSYQITVETLIDVIRSQRHNSWTPLSTQTSAHFYAGDVVSAAGGISRRGIGDRETDRPVKKKKRRRHKKKRRKKKRKKKTPV